MCIVSISAMMILALPTDLNPSIGRVIRLMARWSCSTMLLRYLFLAHQDINIGVGLDAFNGRRVGAALVNGDLFWHVVQVDGTFQKSPGRSQIALGSEQKINCIARPIHGPVKVLPLTGYLDVGLVHPPAQSNGSFASPENCCQHRQHFDCPAMHRCVVDKYAALLHHFLDVAQTQRVGHVPTHVSITSSG